MISLYVFGTSRFAATRPGETPVSRLVEVAAGETAAINLASAIGTKPAVGSDTQAPPSGSDRGGNGLIIAGWIGTGALAWHASTLRLPRSCPRGRSRFPQCAMPGLQLRVLREGVTDASGVCTLPRHAS